MIDLNLIVVIKYENENKRIVTDLISYTKYSEQFINSIYNSIIIILNKTIFYAFRSMKLCSEILKWFILGVKKKIDSLLVDQYKKWLSKLM